MSLTCMILVLFDSPNSQWNVILSINFWGILVEVNPETDEEKIARLETILLQDLRVLKHRQVIHPVLQEGKFS